MRRIGHWIGGKAVDGRSGRTGPVFDPATGEQTGEVDLASVAEVDEAVAAARAAFPAWRRLSIARRAEILFDLRERLHQRRHDLAEAVTAEHGKVLADAGGEVARGIENVEFACGVPSLLQGGYSEQASTGVDVWSIRQPVGVLAGITPFNFPVMVPCWMFATAIACGNTFVLKPSERDPSASILLAEILAEAGVPDGVFNVLQGDREAVEALLEHPDVDGVSFVGSTPVARSIYARAAAAGKRVQALGGAKNHMVVLPDADLGLAADAAVSAAFGSAGERCMAISVVVAVGAVADPLVAEIASRTTGLVVGPGTEAATEMGPLITAEHRDRVASYVGAAEAAGARVVVDGRDLAVDGHPSGFFLGPTVVDDVETPMSVYADEVFGPVLSIVRVPTYEDALDLINASPYGNGTALFTRDGGAARRFQFDVEAGMVGINVPIPVPVAHHSFGGWGQSLFGDTHIYGPEGIRFCTRSKVVTSRWPDPATSTVDLGFPRTR
jgi:malonate-semialdehyde dehydrogenase (acetylating)/methylmalonate-semialdehyde dehydrogenase